MCGYYQEDYLCAGCRAVWGRTTPRIRTCSVGSWAFSRMPGRRDLVARIAPLRNAGDRIGLERLHEVLRLYDLETQREYTPEQWQSHDVAIAQPPTVVRYWNQTAWRCPACSRHFSHPDVIRRFLNNHPSFRG